MLDLELPGLSGRNVLDVLVARGAAVVMLTGHADVETAVEAMQAGAETFLTKPVNFAHLEAAAERVAEKVELRRTNELLARSMADRGGDGVGLGTSPMMRDLSRQVDLLAASADTSVLLLGESGTGKSFIAQLLHARSPRSRIVVRASGPASSDRDDAIDLHSGFLGRGRSPIAGNIPPAAQPRVVCSPRPRWRKT